MQKSMLQNIHTGSCNMLYYVPVFDPFYSLQFHWVLFRKNFSLNSGKHFVRFFFFFFLFGLVFIHSNKVGILHVVHTKYTSCRKKNSCPTWESVNVLLGERNVYNLRRKTRVTGAFNSKIMCYKVQWNTKPKQNNIRETVWLRTLICEVVFHCMQAVDIIEKKYLSFVLVFKCWFEFFVFDDHSFRI